MKIMFIFCQRPWSALWESSVVLLNYSNTFCILPELNYFNNIRWHCHWIGSEVKFAYVSARCFLFGYIKRTSYIISEIHERVLSLQVLLWSCFLGTNSNYVLYVANRMLMDFGPKFCLTCSFFFFKPIMLAQITILGFPWTVFWIND